MRLKTIDRWFGAALVALLPRPGLPSSQILPGSILIIRPGGIGDAVLLVPAINALRERFPEAVIDVLAESRNAGAFALCPGIRRAFLYDRPGQLLEVLRQHYDVVIDTEQWHRLSAVVARLVRSSVKIGFATNERSRLFSHPIPYAQNDFEVTSFLRLLEPLGIPVGEISVGGWLHIPAAAREPVASLMPQDDRRPMVVVFPGASTAEKRWGASRFRSVAEWCLGCRLQVVLIGGKGDRAESEQIASGLDIVNLAGRTSLVQTAAIIDKAAVIVSGDSGVLHIAAGLGRPTVALFGSSSVDKWAPRGPRHVVLKQELPCSPCARFGYTPSCAYSVRCMSDIAVTDVTHAIAKLLELSD